jgi:hypothetical protein
LINTKLKGRTIVRRIAIAVAAIIATGIRATAALANVLNG